MNNSQVIPLNTLDDRHWRVVAAESAILLIINVTGVLGNLCLCVAVYKGITARGTCTNILIVTLSIADLIVSLVAMPMTAAALISGKWHFTDLGCQIQGFLVHLLTFVSLQVMAITAFSRYLRVIKPSRFQILFTKKKTLGMIMLSFSLSTVFLAFLSFRGRSSFVFHPNKVLCVLKFRSIFDSRLFTLITGIIYVITPAVVIITCYSKIFRAIKRHNRNIKANSLRERLSIDTGSTVQSTTRSSPQATARRLTADTIHQTNLFATPSNTGRNTRFATKLSAIEIKITKTIFALIVAFAVCWIPCFTIDLVDTQLSGWLDRKLYLTYTILAYSSSAVNPLIYGGMVSSFRRKHKLTWLKHLR